MMLLDTNSLLWLLEDSERLGAAARRSLSTADAVYSSPISIVEIRIKAMLGKLTVPDALLLTLRSSGVHELVLTDEHADALRVFPELARHDPFDRMLLAQASVSGMILLTADRVLLDLAPNLTQDATN